MEGKMVNNQKTLLKSNSKWNAFYSKNRNGPFLNKIPSKGYFSKNKELFFIGNFNLIY